MEFRDLKSQYNYLKKDIDSAIADVLADGQYILGKQVTNLEQKLAEYVGVKHCISCANGTDALQLALMAWGIGEGDIVFVSDFSFFASVEVISLVGATPVFVDIDPDTFNISAEALEEAILETKNTHAGNLKAVISVDLFGQSADYHKISMICKKYDLQLLEDAAQGFGGSLDNKKNGSFGDISTTSFFPSKPLGCYGDGGAIFTDNDSTAEILKSLRVHGKSPTDKYDNVRIGLNSRLDSIQAAILIEKLKVFKEFELDKVNLVAKKYTKELEDFVKIPVVQKGYYSSWAQYSILLKNKEERYGLQQYLASCNIPSMVFYKKPLHAQKAYVDMKYNNKCSITEEICSKVLSLPIHPYLVEEDIEYIVDKVKEYLRK